MTKLYVSECYKNIYGQMQWKTLFKTDDWQEAEKFFKNHKTKNRLEISDVINAEIIAVKKEE